MRRAPEIQDTAERNADSPAHIWPEKIPPRLAMKIGGDDAGPIARQVVPRAEERRPSAGFTSDPVGDRRADSGDGLLVKYDGRALLLTTMRCAVHCRFCFRKAYPSGFHPDPTTRKNAVARLAEMPRIHEIILSGGDPLMLSNDELAATLGQINAIPHIERIRIHTRMLTAAPDRIDEPLCRLLATRKQLIIVTHVNHPDELDDDTKAALERLERETKTPHPLILLNQSVLLRDVNDNVESLIALSEKLISQGIVPYYLHQLDRVIGAHHFEVPVEKGLRLIDEMRRRCPGYMVPRYVREIPGEPSKTPLF